MIEENKYVFLQIKKIDIIVLMGSIQFFMKICEMEFHVGLLGMFIMEI